MFEALAVRSGDEPDVMYGLLAEDIQVAPDKAWIAFRMHPKARFNNGDPVTAADVKYSFDMLRSKEAAPQYRTQLEGIAGVTVLDARTIRFDLKERTADSIFNIGTLPVFSPKWGRGADGKAKKLDEIVNEYPIASGPYTIASTDSARRIDFQRDPNYWAATRFRAWARQFRRIVYRYYQDNGSRWRPSRPGVRLPHGILCTAMGAPARRPKVG
jgi:ABC-type oligopeptide transport system substrate-binding subunit